ncbi:hypothetical protein [Pseudomonas sp. KCJK9016]|uniref:hypothetical protein n=1 Tax=Pseudomonas sp. KCJK9016 TaxID=3344556 RepID=UPI003906978D
MKLQETCLTSQLMVQGFNECVVHGQIPDKSRDGGGERKNVVFIVYNFFEKCLNQSLAAAFRAPKRCGLLFQLTSGGAKSDCSMQAGAQNQWDV